MDGKKANEFKKVPFKARSVLKGSNLAGISVLPSSQRSHLRSTFLGRTKNPIPGFRPPKTGFGEPSNRFCLGGRGLGSRYQWLGLNGFWMSDVLFGPK